MCCVRGGLECVGVAGVVAGSGGLAVSFESCVEVVGGAILTTAGRHQPRKIGVHPDRSAPALDLHLEQHLVIDSADALMLGIVRRELLGGLRQDRVLDLVQGVGHRWQGESEVIA